MFFFSEAKKCFTSAFEKNRKEQSIKSLLMVCLVMGDSVVFDEIVSKYLVPPDLVEVVKSEYNFTNSSVKVVSFKDKVSNAFHNDPQSLASLMNIWESEYVKNSGL